MEYISGIHALNIPCKLETSGDWHRSALRWENICIKDTDASLFGMFGIEAGKRIPEHKETYFVANHIRACLDMLENCDFTNLQGMNKNYIGNHKYNKIIFEKVYLLRESPNWEKINVFMEKEYRMKWVIFIRGKMSCSQNGE